MWQEDKRGQEMETTKDKKRVDLVCDQCYNHVHQIDEGKLSYFYCSHCNEVCWVIKDEDLIGKQ